MNGDRDTARTASIGVDLGGTNIRAAVFDEGMEILGRSEMPTRAQEDPDDVIRRIAACVREALDRTSIAAGDVAGVGVGAAGLTDWRSGVVVLASNLGWRNVPLKERLEQELDGLRVEVDKDTNAAALAEARLGAGREFRHFLYVTAGTGIGGGLILDGALYRGATGGAGDIGHVVVDPDGPLCGCGGYGHVEVFSSGAGMVNRAREMLADGAQAATSAMAVEGLTTETIFELAKEGDAVATQVVETAGRALGLALADYVNLNNPEAIVLGGGVVRAGRVYTDLVEGELRRRALPALGEIVRLVPPDLGDDVGMAGAALLLAEPETDKEEGGT
ncbi:MAG: ROK family protein [Actinomycetota bacterium]|nr:ROK family protein [Actinomycetota bacterium]